MKNMILFLINLEGLYMFTKTFYVDPELYIKVKRKMIKDKNNNNNNDDILYDSVKDLVIDVWNIFLNNNMNLKGYRFIKGKIIKTTEMKQTSINFTDELNKR